MTVIAIGLVYMTILIDYFTISALNTAVECPTVYSGTSALEELNNRLIYTSLGNIALIVLIFITFSFSLRLVISKNIMVSSIICVVVSTLLIQTIYESRGQAMQTIKKCSSLELYLKPNAEKGKFFILPTNLE